MRHGKFVRLCLVALTATMAIVAATTAGAAPANIAPTILKSAPPGTSMSSPGRGNVYVCPLGINGGQPPGDVTILDVPWRKGLNLSIAAMKPYAVPGAVKMKHEFKITETKTTRNFKGNGIPPWPVGKFPIPKDSKAYGYYSTAAALPPYPTADLIPIKPYKMNITVTKYPKVNKKPSCFDSMSTGVALDGVTWHAELSANQTPTGPVWFEPNGGLPTDNCFGHPWDEHYHIHGFSWKCFTNQGKAGEASPLMGYAFDGFGVYGPLDENGKWITNDQLDECHGRTARVMFNGKMQNIYHYVLNNEYPYSIGCYRGTPAKLPHNMMEGMS